MRFGFMLPGAVSEAKDGDTLPSLIRSTNRLIKPGMYDQEKGPRHYYIARRSAPLLRELLPGMSRALMKALKYVVFRLVGSAV